MAVDSSLFKRVILPGLAFKALVIGGGYATGREIVEYFLLPAGPIGGALAIALAMLVWSVVCIVTFVFARATRSDNYRTFFQQLLGRLWPFAELLFLLSAVITLAVFGAAAGALGEAIFGWPALVGTLALVGGIIGFSAYGNASVEGLFKYVSFLLYGTYAVFVALALTTFGQRVLANFATAIPAEVWAFKGLQYAGYNVIGAVAILPVLRHMRSSRDAVIAGALAGPLAMVPAFLFFICMVAYYPQINSEVLPSDFLLAKLNFPLFHLLFQVMIFSALLECGTGMVHAVNERVASVFEGLGRTFDKKARLTISAAQLIGSVFLATRFGLVDLIDRFYGALGVAFLLVYVLPLMTYGIYRLGSKRRALL
jgi:uncharacterized membrane protein YkvI